MSDSGGDKQLTNRLHLHNSPALEKKCRISAKLGPALYIMRVVLVLSDIVHDGSLCGLRTVSSMNFEQPKIQ